MHGTRGGFDEDGFLVGHRIGHRHELRLVSRERNRPAPAGRLAEARLEPGFEMPERNSLAPVRMTRRTLIARRVDSTYDTREDRNDDRPRAVVEIADHLV